MSDYEIIKYILNDINEDLDDEEKVHLLLNKTVSENNECKESFGQRASDRLSSLAGSWTFVIGFTLLLLVWITVNTVLAAKSFDPYPFILLNLVLSCVSAIQAPLIMMSQKRQDEKDRRRSENDYKINLKCEILLKNMHYKLDRIIECIDENQNKAEKPYDA
jgi:uncharacterized membrane protein